MKPPSTELFFYLLEIIPLKTNFKGGGRKFTEFACFLMFGRHPRLAIDAYLGISLPEESAIVSQDHYATKLKKRLQFAYKVASKEAQKLPTEIRQTTI